MLIAFSGLPGVGKTALARSVATRLGATYLRIDTLEEALIAHGGEAFVEAGAGYGLAYGIAADNLALGTSVVADCVNPISMTREAWRDLAAFANVPMLDILVTCTDRVQHKARIDARAPGTRGASWAEVEAREFEPVDTDTVVIDTSTLTFDECLDHCLAAIDAKFGERAE